MAFIKQIALMPQREKYTGFGFCRENEKSFNLPTIPSMIMYLILMYYRTVDCFKKNDSKMFKLDTNQSILSRIKGDEWNHIHYGKKEVESTGEGTYEWILQCHGSNMRAIIGLSTSSVIGDAAFNWSSYRNDYSYTINTKGVRYERTPLLDEVDDEGKEDCVFKPINDNATIKMTLDLKKKILTFDVEDQKFIFLGIKRKRGKKYRLAVAIHSKGTSIEIISDKMICLN